MCQVATTGEYRNVVEPGSDELRSSFRIFWPPETTDFPFGIRCCALVAP